MKRSGNSFSYFQVIDVCAQPGCPVCTLGRRAVTRHLDRLIYDSVNDTGMRQKLRESLGYCNEHAWQLPEAGGSAPLGIAIIHRDLLNSVRRRLAESEFQPRRASLRKTLNLEKSSARKSSRERYLPQERPCPACTQRDEAYDFALTAVVEALGKADEPMTTALRASDGLCVPHLRRAMTLARNKTAFDALLVISQAKLDELIQHLDEFIRKNDHRFRDETISEAEKESWRKAIQMISGT